MSRSLSLALVLTALTGCSSYNMASGEFGATQGGIQDMGLAREMIASGFVPPPEAFVVEGMFSEHDLPLTGDPCSDLLCLRAEAGLAPDATEAEAGWLQVGMSSTVNPESFERPSQTIVATVDVSGSMGWSYDSVGDGYDSPGVISRHLLHAIVDELGPDDRIAIVTYGTWVKTRMGFTDPTRDKVEREIDDLHTGGSTNMEAGLERAYELAREADFGTDEVRVMLFTDVQPNVGATSGTEFEQMAAQGAEDGVGLTVFAMGVGMGQEVLTSMSHLRGGNAFSLFSVEDADELMADSWPWMVSPIAYDLSVDVAVPDDLDLVHAYGFPPGDLEQASSSLDVATVFLSRRKGAMLLELSPLEEGALEDLSLAGTIRYTTTEGEELEADVQASYDGSPLDERGHWYGQHSVGRTVALALLVQSMKDSAAVYATDPSTAISTMEAASGRFEADSLALGDVDLEAEVELSAELLRLMQDGAEQTSLYGW